MTRYVIGVDGGASKTTAVVMNEERQELGRAQGGPANYYLQGMAGVKESLLSAMQAAIQDAGLEFSQISAVTWALAGAGRPNEAQKMEALRAERFPGLPGNVVSDAVGALVGGSGTRRGMVLIAGTGMMAYGENAAGESARAGGWGHLLDHGSGYALGRAALQAVTASVDGTDFPTRLQDDVQNALNLDQPEDLIGWLYDPERRVAEFAALAPLVLNAAEDGDLLATDLLLQAAEALTRAADRVAHRLGLWTQPFPLVLSGGIFQGNEFFRRVVSQAIRTRIPQANPQLPRTGAAVGAAWLALEALGHPLEALPAEPTTPANTWTSEDRNVLTRDLDLHATLNVIGLMHLEDVRAVNAVRPTLPEIAGAIDAIASRMVQGGRLVYVGAGTSGRMGALDASECPPTFGSDPSQIFSLIAGGEQALTRALEGAEDNREAGKAAIAAAQIGPLDSVVGIAASGRTPYVLGALEEARARGALTLAILCNLPAPLAENADHVIAPLVGAEALSGSTRLKAGTAQKLILNMISTGVMVRLGKTYGNLMVDVAQHNSKLRNRARRIVAQACEVDDEQAAAALDHASGDVRAAIVSILLQCPPEEAKSRLAQANGDIRAAIST